MQKPIFSNYENIILSKCINNAKRYNYFKVPILKISGSLPPAKIDQLKFQKSARVKLTV
jgi:hypothetical protein